MRSDDRNSLRVRRRWRHGPPVKEEEEAPWPVVAGMRGQREVKGKCVISSHHCFLDLNAQDAYIVGLRE
jgi:hypothetical protein